MGWLKRSYILNYFRIIGTLKKVKAEWKTENQNNRTFYSIWDYYKCYKAIKDGTEAYKNVTLNTNVISFLLPIFVWLSYLIDSPILERKFQMIDRIGMQEKCAHVCMCTHTNTVEEDHIWTGIMKRQLCILQPVGRSGIWVIKECVLWLGIWEVEYVNRKKNGSNGMVYLALGKTGENMFENLKSFW